MLSLDTAFGDEWVKYGARAGRIRPARRADGPQRPIEERQDEVRAAWNEHFGR